MPESVSSSGIAELMANNASKGWAYYTIFKGVFRYSSSKKINVRHIPKMASLVEMLHDRP